MFQENYFKVKKMFQKLGQENFFKKSFSQKMNFRLERKKVRAMVVDFLLFLFQLSWSEISRTGMRSRRAPNRGRRS